MAVPVERDATVPRVGRHLDRAREPRLEAPLRGRGLRQHTGGTRAHTGTHGHTRRTSPFFKKRPEPRFWSAPPPPHPRASMQACRGCGRVFPKGLRAPTARPGKAALASKQRRRKKGAGSQRREDAGTEASQLARSTKRIFLISGSKISDRLYRAVASISAASFTPACMLEGSVCARVSERA